MRSSDLKKAKIINEIFIWELARHFSNQVPLCSCLAISLRITLGSMYYILSVDPLAWMPFLHRGRSSSAWRAIHLSDAASEHVEVRTVR